MKGIVFTEFLDFVEAEAGYEIVDAMICEANPDSDGAYTAVGQYKFQELANMIGSLSKLTGTPAPQLIRAFGRHLFGRFHKLYPQFFTEASNAFEFLDGIESKIHTEVRKLYPDAKLPRIETLKLDGNRMEMHYSSCRPLGELCLGLIEGCSDYFNEKIDVQGEPTENGLHIKLNREMAAVA